MKERGEKRDLAKEILKKKKKNLKEEIKKKRRVGCRILIGVIVANLNFSPCLEGGNRMEWK